jgi:hypothetical protein
MRKLALAALALAPLSALAAAPEHFSLAASYVPPSKAGANGTVAVLFTPKGDDVHINESPAPRLKLDPEQRVLVDRQPPAPARVEPYDPEKVRYIDLALPVTFPVGLAADAAKGLQTVKATVIYFYCSKSQGWCRRGSTAVDVAVTVR